MGRVRGERKFWRAQIIRSGRRGGARQGSLMRTAVAMVFAAALLEDANTFLTWRWGAEGGDRVSGRAMRQDASNAGGHGGPRPRPSTHRNLLGGEGAGIAALGAQLRGGHNLRLPLGREGCHGGSPRCYSRRAEGDGLAPGAQTIRLIYLCRVVCFRSPL